MTRFERVASMVAALSFTLLGLYVCLVVVNVVCRYVLGFSLTFLADAAEILLPSALVLFFPIAAIRQSHLKLEFLGAALPGLRPVLDQAARLILTGFLGVICWQMLTYTQEKLGSGATTTFHGIAIWPVWGFTVLAYGLATLLTVFARRTDG